MSTGDDLFCVGFLIADDAILPRARLPCSSQIFFFFLSTNRVGQS